VDLLISTPEIDPPCPPLELKVLVPIFGVSNVLISLRPAMATATGGSSRFVKL